jgi:hypothetical protein
MKTKAASAERLHPTGGLEQRGAQPVGPGLTGSANGPCHVLRFLRRQSNSKDNRDAFFGQPGPAHFLFHGKITLSLTNVLDNMLIFVNISLVSKFEIAPCQNNTRTSLARLADQRHPAVTGAGNERLAMKARSLKIEKTGDFRYGKIIPRIRIAGQWLEQAGFKPGHRVQVLMEQPGSLSLRIVTQGREVVL